VWAGHGGSADGPGGGVAGVPGGGDVGSRGEDLQAISPVGEARAGVGVVGSSNADSLSRIRLKEEKNTRSLQQQH